MTTKEINDTISLVAQILSDRFFGEYDEIKYLAEKAIEDIPDKDVREHVRIIVGLVSEHF